MTSGTQPRRVLYWIMCAAPPVQDWQTPARQLQEDGWDLYAIPTQTATSWLDLDSLAQVTGHEVRTRPRLPHETDELPPAGAVLVAAATFNTLNQWAVGINDTLALGLLNELLGLKVQIVVAMYCKAALAAHPAYRPNITRLQQAGATVLEGKPRSPSGMTVSHGRQSVTRSRRSGSGIPNLDRTWQLRLWRRAGRDGSSTWAPLQFQSLCASAAGALARNYGQAVVRPRHGRPTRTSPKQSPSEWTS
jgi:phosphopantothenoylcysteine decarboxylase